MARKQQYMTLQDHLDTAKDLAEASAALCRVVDRIVSQRFAIRRDVKTDILSTVQGLMVLCSEFESEYHQAMPASVDRPSPYLVEPCVFHAVRKALLADRAGPPFS